MKTHTKFLIGALLASSVLGAQTAQAAPAWASPAKDLTLFYPGQSSWEWALTPADHPGAEKFRGGKNCAGCHSGDEKTMGALLVSGKKNEPSPIAGKPGSMDGKVQFSHDADTLYVKFTYSEAGQPNANMDPAHASKVTMIIAGPGGSEANRAGCWGACHDDGAGMASGGTGTRTMYLGKTRAASTRKGGGDALKPAADLQKLKASGYELEYWQARVNGAAATPVNGVIFDKREEVKPTDITVQASSSGGKTTVIMSRKLSGGAVPIEAGKRYTVAFAVHAGHTAKRFHYVSFERSLVLDQGEADFVAK